MKGNKDFINRLVFIMSDSLELSADMSRGIPCSRYSSDDYTRYVNDLMSAKEVVFFEEHSRDCMNCLKGVYQSHKKMTDQKEQRENEALLKKTYDLLTSLDKTVVSILMQTIIKATGNVLELLSTTGEVLRAPSLVTVRGESATQEKTESLRIIQEFSEPPVSVQISMEMDEKEDILDLRVSLFDRVKDEFMVGILIDLAVYDKHEKRITNENGEALFKIEKQGEYRITLTADADEIGEILLTVNG